LITRVEILEVDVDPETKQAMQLQLNAERNRRALVREAEGKKQATELDADAQLYAAQKQAEAMKITADAEAYSVSVVSQAIAAGGASAVEFEIKKVQAQAVQELARGQNAKIVLLPTEVVSSLSGTLSGVVAQLTRKD
jgi:regulator of protease activity HflC (stomatin/prohibitin superfamily)